MQLIKKLSLIHICILTGLFHQRIAYPDLNKDKKPASDKPEQAKVQAKPEEKTEQRPDVKRTVAYAASSVMPGSSGARAAGGFHRVREHDDGDVYKRQPQGWFPERERRWV